MNVSRAVSTKWVIIVLVGLLVTFASDLMAGPDVILVDLRLYEGERASGAGQAKVTSTYYLKPMFSGSVILDVGLSEEKGEIKKIFNLNDLRLVTKADLGLKAGKRQRQSKVLTIDGREFLIQLAMSPEDHSFLLEVVEKTGSRKKILETVILLPQQKSSVFGFENSQGKPFFISIQRKKDAKDDDEDVLSVKSLKLPRLIEKVNPVYPKEALKAKVQGTVTLEAIADVNGKVVKLEVLSGPEALREASLDAVRRWVYEPYIMDGKPKPVKFTVMVKFNLSNDEDAGASKDTSKGLAAGKMSSAALVENVNKKSYTGEPLDLVFKNAKLEDVMAWFTESTGIKIRIQPGVAEKVTCDLHRTPWDRAFAEILQNLGLAVQLQGDAVNIIKKK